MTQARGPNPIQGAGSADVATDCLLAAAGIDDPTPKQRAGFGLVARGLADLHYIATVKRENG